MWGHKWRLEVLVVVHHNHERLPSPLKILLRAKDEHQQRGTVETSPGLLKLTRSCLPASCSHILRHIEETSLDTIEITGSQMVLCMKLISFAWSVYDGQRPDEELDATQRGSRIQEVPGLIPFLGYA